MKWFFFAFVISLLGLFFFTNDLQLFHGSIDVAGHVLKSEGNAMGKAFNAESFTQLAAGESLTSSHDVKTGSDGKASISYGESFQLLSNTSIRLYALGNKHQVHILSGEVLRPDPSGPTEFFVDNKRVEDQSHIRIPSPTPPQDALPFNPKLNSEKSTEQKLLSETFQLHQRFLEKCFIKHYELKEGRTESGQILIEFDIQKSGKLDDISVKRSSYDDNRFHECIKEVVSRIRIRHYKGEMARVEFPIQISLPH